MATKLIVVTTMALICLSSKALSQQVLGPMQAFQDYCLNDDPSIEAITAATTKRHLKLLVDRQLPGNNSSIMRQKTWLINDKSGDFSLIVTQDGGSTAGESVLCGVTLPKGVGKQVELALSDQAHFGVPDAHKVNPDGSTVATWTKAFAWGDAEVGLVTQVPSLQGASMLSVRYRLK